MMTPKQFEFFFTLMETSCKAAYDRGVQEAKAPPTAPTQFVMSKAAKLTVQTHFKKQFPNG